MLGIGRITKSDGRNFSRETIHTSILRLLEINSTS